MKRFLLLSLFIPTLLPAQFNLQQHYDLRRQIQTTTAEYFKAGEKEVVFAFIDINADRQHFDKTGATDAWYELAWYRPLLAGPFNYTVQYNDGIYFSPGDDGNLASPLAAAWLAGVSYPLTIGGTSLPIDLLAGWQPESGEFFWQATVVWFTPVTERISCSGFSDLWYDPLAENIAWLTEAQFTYSFNQLAVGTELKLSRGFAGAWTKKRGYFTVDDQPRTDEFWLLPTLFIKYTF